MTMHTKGLVLKLHDLEEVSLYSDETFLVSLGLKTATEEYCAVSMDKNELTTLRDLINLVLKEDKQ